MTHLEHVECLELDVLALIPQHVHHELQVLGVGDKLGHDREVGAVEKKLAQQLHVGAHVGCGV